MELIPCNLETSQVAKDGTIDTDCIAIEISNQSTNSLNEDTGESVGYVLVINNAKRLLPGASWSFSTPFGTYLKSKIKLAFEPTGTTPTTDIKQATIIKAIL